MPRENDFEGGPSVGLLTGPPPPRGPLRWRRSRLDFETVNALSVSPFPLVPIEDEGAWIVPVQVAVRRPAGPAHSGSATFFVGYGPDPGATETFLQNFSSAGLVQSAPYQKVLANFVNDSFLADLAGRPLLLGADEPLTDGDPDHFLTLSVLYYLV